MSRTGEKLALDKAMETWQAKALVYTQGQHTQLGAIICAICKAEPSRGPKFGPNAFIAQDGRMFANMIDRNNKYHQGVMICSVENYISSLHRLADKIKLSEADKADMFRRAREWVRVDYRAQPNWGKIAATH